MQTVQPGFAWPGFATLRAAKSCTTSIAGKTWIITLADSWN